MPDEPVAARPQMVPDGPFQRGPPGQIGHRKVRVPEHELNRFGVGRLARLPASRKRSWKRTMLESAPRYRFSCGSSSQE